MENNWQYQLRLDLSEKFAEIARRDLKDPLIAPLADVLDKHQTKMKCQFDAFADYVAEAESKGTDKYHLYEWTKATIEDPEKKAKFLKSFALYIEGKEVYPKDKADALEADLRPLVGGELILKMSKYDSNPVNNPQPPARK